MWRINLKVNLPPGYEVKENEDFIFLFDRNNKKIGTFGKADGVSEEIRKEAFKHFNKAE